MNKPTITYERQEQCRSFLSRITHRDVRPFIDVQKLYGSDIFEETIQMAINNAIDHGNFGYIQRLLELVYKTPSYQPFLKKVSDQIPYSLIETNPPKIVKHTIANEYLAANQIEKNDKANPAKKPIITIKEKKPYRDIMDSHLMYPGSYGTSRRR